MDKIRFILAFAVLASLRAVCSAAEAPKIALNEGDIVFIESQTRQAPVIQAVTGSSWTHVGVAIRQNNDWVVAETAKTVSLTPLADFIGRSRDGKFAVKRYKEWSKKPDRKGLAALKKWLLRQSGKPYDIYFEWSDTALYCSEYVWKAYFNALPGHPQLSVPQKFSELNLSGPLPQALKTQRYGAANKQFNPDEPIVTPVALFNSDRLVPVN